MKNYYEILEVNPKASIDIIKKVYKIKVKQNHPDLFQNEEKLKAEEITKEITEAYNILSNHEKRSKYDKELENDNYNSAIQQYENIISSLKEENEYLKKVLISKNDMINNFIDIDSNLNKNYNNTNNYINKQQNITNNSNNNREYFNSILFDLKQLGFKLGVFFIVLLLLLLFFGIFTGYNIFNTF